MPDEQTDTTTEPTVVTVELPFPTWDNVTPEQYEAAPFTTGWPWCEPGEYPVSYKWEAQCKPVQTCQAVPQDPTVGYTLWTVDACVPEQATVSAVPDAQKTTNTQPVLTEINGPATVTGAPPAVPTRTADTVVPNELQPTCRILETGEVLVRGEFVMMDHNSNAPGTIQASGQSCGPVVVETAEPPVAPTAEVAVATDAPATLPSTGPAEAMGTAGIALALVAIGAALFGISKRKKVNHELDGIIS